MQVIRDERLAKLQALSIVAVMALVAIAVHFWPREAGVVMTPSPIVAAHSTPAPERQRAFRTPTRVTARPPRPVPGRVAAFETVPTELAHPSSLPGAPAIASLAALPGTPFAVSRAPSAPTSGGVTGAMQTTGKSLAGAFKKTGSAFRRAF
jgi:hypothetical protein